MSINPMEIRAALRRGPHDFLDVGHSRLAHWRFGSGPDLVFVHGWPLHSATFRDLVPALASSFTCHLFDLPCSGLSESGPDVPIGLAEHGETVRKVIDALGLSRFAYVAHDSGAVFARLAAAGDSRVAGLVIAGTEIPGHVPGILKLYKSATKVPGSLGLMRRLMKMRAFRTSQLAFGTCFSDPRTTDGEFGDLFIRPILESNEALHRQMRLIERLDFGIVDKLVEVHGHIRAPALLIWGEKDPIFPLAKARHMPEQFGGGAELRVIDGARTFLHEDHPEEFLEHARPFLAQCFTRPEERRIAAA